MTRPKMNAARTTMNPIAINGTHILLAIACIPVTRTGNWVELKEISRVDG